MINDVKNDYKLLRKNLSDIKVKINGLIISYDSFLKKIKDGCCIDNNILKSTDLAEVLDKLKDTELNLETVLSSIKDKI